MEGAAGARREGKKRKNGEGSLKPCMILNNKREKESGGQSVREWFVARKKRVNPKELTQKEKGVI